MAVSMEFVIDTLTHASACLVGKDTCVTSLYAGKGHMLGRLEPIL
jgi:hypothetical protein